MGALDKLNKRKEEDTKSKAPARQKAKAAAPKKAAPKATVSKTAKPVRTKKPVKKEIVLAPAAVEEPKIIPEPVTVAPDKEIEKVTDAKKLGRPVVRGEKNKDYRMVNLAVPIDMYDELKSHAGGNVTFFINQLLREALDQRKY